QRGVPRAQLAMAWVLRNPVITSPLVGVTKSGHIDDAVAALDVVLTDDEIAALEAPYTPRAIVGFS
ncbi:MAG: aldo/keto reductase, partial [Nakamurella sp.]